MIGIHYHWSKSLTSDEKRYKIPVAVAVSGLAHSLRDRVANRGETGDGGKFRPLVIKRKGKRTLRRFYKSGQLWQSLTVVATAIDKVSVAFRGKRRGHGEKSVLTNPQIAWLLNQKESTPILKPNAAEISQLSQDLATLAPQQWLSSAPVEAGKLRAVKKDAREQAKIQKAKALRAQLKALGVRFEGVE